MSWKKYRNSRKFVQICMIFFPKHNLLVSVWKCFAQNFKWNPLVGESARWYWYILWNFYSIWHSLASIEAGREDAARNKINFKAVAPHLTEPALKFSSRTHRNPLNNEWNIKRRSVENRPKTFNRSQKKSIQDLMEDTKRLMKIKLLAFSETDSSETGKNINGILHRRLIVKEDSQPLKTSLIMSIFL